MLSIKLVISISLLHFFVCGNENQPSKYDDMNLQQKLPDSNSSYIPCGPEKSLHSRKDIQVMIDHIYNMKSINDMVKENYYSKAEAVQYKHLQNLIEFTAWFKNKPEHLSHVLQNIAMIRKQNVEPVVEKVAAVLSDYSKFEMFYNEKNDKTNQLLNRLSRYDMICQFNCESDEVEAHNIAKRNVQKDFYCSSLKDLHDEISLKLSQLVQELNSDTDNKLSSKDKLYEEKIDEIKNKLKDKALQKFGRTMYDILSLEDEYHHFLDDLTSKELDGAEYTIKMLGLSIDTKLLDLERVIAQYGRYCNNCGSDDRFVRNTREANTKLKSGENIEAPNIVNDLIEIKRNEIKSDIETNWNNTFNDLDAFIKESETEEINLEDLKPIQEEVKSLIVAEKEALNNLKNMAPKISIKKLLDLIKKLSDLLKLILSIIEAIFDHDENIIV